MATTQIPRIDAKDRSDLGTRNTVRLRKTGQIPVVIYGHGKEPVHAAVDSKKFIEIAHRNVHLVEVAVGGAAEPCLIKELQWDYLGSTVIHVDLARVDLTQKVEVEVQVVLFGEPKVDKEEGAFLQQFAQTIEIKCLVTQIPESIRVDVSALVLGEHISVKDLKLPEGVTAVSDSEMFIAGIVRAAEEEVVAPVEGAATAEPEVIGRKAEDEDGEAAPADGKEAKKAEKPEKGEKK